MKPALMLLVLLAFLPACAPRGAQSQSPEDTRLEAGEWRTLLEPFLPLLAQLGVVPQDGTAFVASANNQNALIRAVNRFYRENPGFCPLREGAFQSAPEGRRFMTLTAKGTEARLLVYDRAEPDRLRYAFIQGISTATLPISACRTPGS